MILFVIPKIEKKTCYTRINQIGCSDVERLTSEPSFLRASLQTNVTSCKHYCNFCGQANHTLANITSVQKPVRLFRFKHTWPKLS